MSTQPRKPLKWVGSAKRDLDGMPEDVQDVFGHAIDLAQAGGKHPDAKALSGFGSAAVLEVVEDFRSDTFRAVYTVKFAGWVYVLQPWYMDPFSSGTFRWRAMRPCQMKRFCGRWRKTAWGSARFPFP